jgi:hypothetical protein
MWKLRRGRGLSSLHALVVRAALSVVCPLNANRSAIHPSDVRRCMLRLTGELRTNSADPSLTPDTDGNLLGKDINNDSKLSTSRTVPHKIHPIYPRLDRLDPCCYVSNQQFGRAKRPPECAHRSHRWTVRPTTQGTPTKNNSSTFDPRIRSTQTCAKRPPLDPTAWCLPNVRQPSSTTRRRRVKQAPTVTNVPCLALLRGHS